ncbi:hypothetical protein Y032_0030g2027 [Ancylostoma ceylanicum]|uniref:Uncharacterized protein n=1 Tax=Ancylostoma ceylanicum TaxID=53326 RepID=A0A016URE2_9BILA|nr:hypothetical protein Y032_0030g2027 [Ancylostoma ceylanicum]
MCLPMITNSITSYVTSEFFTNVGVFPSFNTGNDHRLLRARLHFDRGQVRQLRIRSKRPRPTVIDEEMIGTVAAEETFEMVDDVNEDYTRLVGTIIKIRNECRAEAPKHASRRVSTSTRALLEKRRHMDQQANHVEYAVRTEQTSPTVSVV